MGKLETGEWQTDQHSAQRMESGPFGRTTVIGEVNPALRSAKHLMLAASSKLHPKSITYWEARNGGKTDHGVRKIEIALAKRCVTIKCNTEVIQVAMHRDPPSGNER